MVVLEAPRGRSGKGRQGAGGLLDLGNISVISIQGGSRDLGNISGISTVIQSILVA